MATMDRCSMENDSPHAPQDRRTGSRVPPQDASLTNPPHRSIPIMTDLFENPMGLMGFEFVEFASPERGVLEPVLEKLGFAEVARHRSKNVSLYRQGDINFIVNREPRSVAAYFAA